MQGLDEALNYLKAAKEQFQAARTMQYDLTMDWSALVMDWTLRYNALKMQSEAEIKRIQNENKILKIGCGVLGGIALGAIIFGIVEALN
jgi:hypothetical protein